MDKKWKLTLVVSVLVIVASAGGLALAAQDDDDGDHGAGTGLANPAAVFCEEQGGNVEVVTEADGSQSGICRLPDGTQIEEWEYYRQFNNEGNRSGLANPAAVFCEEQGGNASGVEPMCELPGGVVVDAWEYFRSRAP